LFQLDIAEEKLKITTTMDDLTKTYNRRYFFEIAEQELARVQRYGGTFSIAILDFDNFKNINDNYGHQAGDRALMELSRICSSNIRLPDLFARYGGDEFVFLFPESNKEKANQCLKRIFTDISNFSLDFEETQVKIRVSIGIAELSHEEPFIDHILKNADIALYRAKHDGGNKIA
jgi:diguanylate cyclase (GGDEF)-like protein